VTDGSDPRERTALASSVRTPLGFFALVALILDGALIATAAATERLSLWPPLILLAALVAAFLIVILVKPLALYHPADWPAKANSVTVCLVFPVQAIDLDFDTDQCLVEVRDLRGRRRFKGGAGIVLGHGGWTVRLSEDIEPSDSVRLELRERNGDRWTAGPFAPYERSIDVTRGRQG
jgi:hypothetical protein